MEFLPCTPGERLFLFLEEETENVKVLNWKCGQTWMFEKQPES